MRFVNNRRDKVSFVTSQEEASQVPSFHSCDYFDLANCLEFRFVHVLVGWLFATQTAAAHPAIMGVDELWGAGVSDYTNNALIRGHRYKHVIESCVSFPIGVVDLRVVMVKRVVAA